MSAGQPAGAGGALAALGLRIRDERPAEADRIAALITEAFSTVAYASGYEARIVERLRAAGALSLSRVCTKGTEIIGHIAVSPVTIGGEEGWVGIGPLAVLPAWQRRGVGSALMMDALEQIRGQGARGAVLVGDPGYYGRFGFAAYPGLRMEGVPPENVLALPFAEAAPEGEPLFHPAFAPE